MICYRLAKAEYADDLSGRGAEISGGRWNSKGTPVLYTCESRSLCLLEIAVLLSVMDVPDDYKLVTIELDDKLVKEIQESELPKDWQMYPHLKYSQVFGDGLLKSDKHRAFMLPSAIVPAENNIIINTRQLDLKKIRIIAIDDFYIDERLMR